MVFFLNASRGLSYCFLLECKFPIINRNINKNKNEYYLTIIIKIRFICSRCTFPFSFNSSKCSHTQLYALLLESDVPVMLLLHSLGLFTSSSRSDILEVAFYHGGS